MASNCSRSDVGIGLSDGSDELVENLLAPPDGVSGERPKGEQEVPQRRGEENTGVEDDDGQGAADSVRDSEVGVGFCDRRHPSESLFPFPSISQDVRCLEAAMGSHHVSRNAALVDEADEIGAGDSDEFGRFPRRELRVRRDDLDRLAGR